MAMHLPELSRFDEKKNSSNTGQEHWPIEWIDRNHPDRVDIQDYISTVFLKTYGAKVNTFCDTLIGCRNTEGNWIAAVGHSLARNGRTFLEQYLDVPLENAIAAHVRVPVCRDHIVEVGNLASSHVGAARSLIIGMTRYLHEQGLTWVAWRDERGAKVGRVPH